SASGDLAVDARSINTIDVTRTFAHVGSGSSVSPGEDEGEEPQGSLWDTITGFIDGLELDQELKDVAKAGGESADSDAKVAESKPDNAYAGAIAIVTTDNVANALIGEDAFLTIQGDAHVRSEALDPFQVSASANVGALRPAGETSVGGALVFGRNSNQAHSFV